GNRCRDGTHKRRPTHHPAVRDPQGQGDRKKKKKKRKCLAKAAALEVQHVGTPLISKATGCPSRSILLDANRLYAIGRSASQCDFLLPDPRVSNPHCSILFDGDQRKVFIFHSGFHPTNSFKFREKVGEEHEAPRAPLSRVFVNGVECKQGSVVALSAGDEILFVCGTDKCSSGVRIGFAISRIVILDEGKVVCPGSDDPSAVKGRFSLPWTTTTTTTTSSSSKRVSASWSTATSLGPSSSSVVYSRAKSLLAQCRHILHSADPISCIRRCPFFLATAMPASFDCNSSSGSRLHPFSKKPTDRGGEPELANVLPINKSDTICNMPSMRCRFPHPLTYMDPTEKVVSSETDGKGACVSADAGNLSQRGNKYHDNADPITSYLNQVPVETGPCFNSTANDENGHSSFPPPGMNFCLNRLESIGQGSFGCSSEVSLVELIYPVESIVQIFIATFTCDIPWFLSHCQIPDHLPVTIACHNTDRCWSSSPEQRTLVPYPEFPKLVVVYPPFPEIIAFGGDRRKQGIACHHPKLLVFQREGSIRIIITSANLVSKQWTGITNTVWWQDFPRRSAPDFSSLFTQISDDEMTQGVKSDFAAQLAGFMASLVIDAPSQAHWVVELTKFDFNKAVGYLIASVPGIHSSDSDGTTLRKLASFLSESHVNASGMLETTLRRETNIPADYNAVSILVRNPNNFFKGDCIRIGFLPRNFAKWVSPLWDEGFFSFSGYICPKEVLAAALGGNNKKVSLTLNVFQGASFSELPKLMQHHVNALCYFIASIERCRGLYRLREVLDRYRWPESLESDFVYGSSSIGSINAQFLAAFSAAAGKRSLQLSDSQESDPEWGFWTASQELKNPSIRIIFPTIERAKTAIKGISASKQILCFSEKTWQRLKTADILYDAIPYPSYRIGHPSHAKVAMRRFKSRASARSFGWVYCGSHNFSAAAWGRLISSQSGGKVDTPGRNDFNLKKLHICNYELGILFVVPPTETLAITNGSHIDLDNIVLPFVMPAPKYRPCDRPATAKAMWEAGVEISGLGTELSEVPSVDEMMEENLDGEQLIEVNDQIAAEEEDAFANQLWSQVDASQSC
ncbi:FHA domain-containing protein, partial [Psidium guajava]